MDCDAAAAVLANAKRILIVPGYGVAMSRCQAELAETAKMLLGATRVEFGVSPIAGRIPGHISLFLQDVPEHFIRTGREVNQDIYLYDVCLIVGANDVVNPTVQERAKPAKGMVIEAWRVPHVIALRRSSKPKGPPGSPQENPTFSRFDVSVLPGDAKRSLSSLNSALRHLVGGAWEGKGWPPLRVDDDPSTGSNTRRAWPKAEKTVGVLREHVGAGILPLDPQGVQRLRELGLAVLIERESGEEGSFTTEEYMLAGGEICEIDEVLQAEVLLHPSTPPLEYFVPPQSHQGTAATKEQESAATAAAAAAVTAASGKGRLLICNHPSGRTSALLEALAEREWTVLSVDAASPALQARGIDVVSAMESLRGYRAVIESLFALPRLAKGLTTAAGRIDPAIVLIFGAGVAGLHAAAAAYRAGAKVYVADPKASAKPVVESVGGIFLFALTSVPSWDTLNDFSKVVDGLRLLVQKSDIILCAPYDFWGPPPKLIPDEWLEGMKAGSVVVDLVAGHPAASSGWYGSVQGAPQGTPQEGPPLGVTILNGSTLEQAMPRQATRMFSESICNLLQELKSSPSLIPQETDRILRRLLLVEEGTLVTPEHWSLFKGKRTLSKLKMPSLDSAPSPSGGILADLGSKFFET